MWINLGNHLKRKDPTKFWQYLLMLMCFLNWWLTFFQAHDVSLMHLSTCRPTYFFIDVPLDSSYNLFLCWFSSTSSFKHWASPFKETLMTFIHTNKTRHIWHLETTILLALKFITPSIINFKAYFFSLIVKHYMCRKKHGEKLGNAPKSMHF